MKLWIMSDLHQEFSELRWRPDKTPDHDVLVLAGDIDVACAQTVHTGDMGNGLYLRHGWQSRAERVVDGLQGSLLKIDIAEGVEAGLLLQTVLSGRPCRLGLEGAVHALMAAVLLRVAGLDALKRDAEPQPEDGQPGEIVKPVWRGEGDTVVQRARWVATA